MSTFKSLDFGEKWFAVFFTVVVALILVIITYCSFMPKKQLGYYLNHGGTGYQIFINWDNWPDEIAYKSYDGDKAMAVYKELKNEFDSQRCK